MRRVDRDERARALAIGDQALTAAVDPALHPHIEHAQEALVALWGELVGKGIDQGAAYGMTMGVCLQVLLHLDRATRGTL